MEHFFVVSQWDGRTFKIALTQKNSCETLQTGKLKHKLMKMLNITDEELYLVHNGLLLDDDATGKEFGLKAGDVLYLFKRQSLASSRSSPQKERNRSFDTTHRTQPPVASYYSPQMSQPPKPFVSSEQEHALTFDTSSREQLLHDISLKRQELYMLNELMKQKEELQIPIEMDAQHTFGNELESIRTRTQQTIGSLFLLSSLFIILLYLSYV